MYVYITKPVFVVVVVVVVRYEYLAVLSDNSCITVKREKY